MWKTIKVYGNYPKSTDFWNDNFYICGREPNGQLLSLLEFCPNLSNRIYPNSIDVDERGTYASYNFEIDDLQQWSDYNVIISAGSNANVCKGIEALYNEVYGDSGGQINNFLEQLQDYINIAVRNGSGGLKTSRFYNRLYDTPGESEYISGFYGAETSLVIYTDTIEIWLPDMPYIYVEFEDYDGREYLQNKKDDLDSWMIFHSNDYFHEAYLYKYLHYGETLQLAGFGEIFAQYNSQIVKDGINFYFDKWNIDSELEIDVNTPIVESLQFTAEYGRFFYITVEINDDTLGSVTVLQQSKPGDQVKLKAIPNENANFIGWSIAGNFISTSLEYNFIPSEDLIICAVFLKDLSKVKVLFKSDIDNILYEAYYNIGETPLFPGSPSKSDTALYTYIFSGWIPEIKKIEEYSDEPIIYKANFNAIINNYQIVFKNYDGSILQSDMIAYGLIPQYTLSYIPFKDNMTKFLKWSPDIASVTQDQEYTAVYEFDYTNSLKIDTFDFGKDDSWHFAIIPIDPNELYIMKAFDGISELKFHNTDPNNVKDPVLKYWNFRDSEGPNMKLWKHGQAGLYDNQGKIKPTFWYGKQHEFNFEFVVNQTSAMLKIFNNLKIISNKTSPNKFEYEVVGEGYDWYKYKPIIQWVNDFTSEQKFINESDYKDFFENLYYEILTIPYDDLCTKYGVYGFPTDLWELEGRLIQKIPFLHIETCDRKGRQDKSYHKTTDYWDGLGITPGKDDKYSFNCSETILVEDEQLNELRVHTESLGNDVRRYGRVRGNMQYLEDLWDIEIRPILIKWASSNPKYQDGLNIPKLLFKKTESRHRDKYLKVKVRYTGEDLAVIQGIITMFDYSYA